ncbi:hypothetical protein B0T25DRAFT_607481 [Lasiosphaeria hispida]|uniref:SRR1-like domain-containing protein n=1 Tax=Lasiosphaeria hispida TaxID=260671 RepID=A0AAJ0HIF3_9PEZI|nr:hypothetical protein B0T25DRAFT_607481 [Lasiosphaeria hispida]
MNEHPQLVGKGPIVDSNLENVAGLRARARWETSMQCLALKGIIDKFDIPPVNKMIAIASGSLTFDLAEDDPDPESETYGTFIHNIMLTLQDMIVSKLERSGSSATACDISCYTQDPTYSPIDQKVLGDEGIAILEDPDRFLEMNDQTVIFCNSPAFPVRNITLDIARPAMMIWNRMMLIEPRVGTDALTTQRLNAMTSDS